MGNKHFSCTAPTFGYKKEKTREHMTIVIHFLTHFHILFLFHRQEYKER